MFILLYYDYLFTYVSLLSPLSMVSDLPVIVSTMTVSKSTTK